VIEPKGVSVVVCAHTERRFAELQGAVESVRAQTVPAKEIIVVIDHNPELLTRASEALPDVRVVENAGEQGAGEARNSGVNVASGPILGFLDDDAMASPTWIEQGVRAFEDEHVMGVGGTIIPAWEGEPRRWFPAEFNWTIGCTYPGLPTSPAPVRNLIAANMFVRHSLFDELGGFRAGFGKTKGRSGVEETDLCLRGNQRWPDRIWLYDPAVLVRHRVPEDRLRLGYFIARCYDEGVAKAALVGFLGSEDGLAAERVYTRRTLPRGVAQGLWSTVSGRDMMGAGRSAAIVVGLSATVAGYLLGRYQPDGA
jgi:glycosyltransferase involved in cell wall biosynthesis